MPISVSEDQYLTIFNAANVLCPADRDEFVAAVAHELAGQSIGDGALHRAIAVAFRTFFHPPEGIHPVRWDRCRPRSEKARPIL
jgi:hypothetical protein